MHYAPTFYPMASSPAAKVGGKTRQAWINGAVHVVMLHH